MALSVVDPRHDHGMSLTKLLDIKQSPVRQFMDREFPGTAPVTREANALIRGDHVGDPPVAPAVGADPGLVGTAVEFVLPAPYGFIREPLIAVGPNAGLDSVRRRVGELAVAELRQLGGLAERLSGASLERAADCALVCARLEQRFRTGDERADQLGIPDPAIGLALSGGLDGAIEAARITPETRDDLIALLDAALADTADLYSTEVLAIDPTFALSRAVGGADADVIAGGLLVDFKSSKARSLITAKEIYQLVGYALLDSEDRYKISDVGIHALRWRVRWTIALDDLLYRISGVKRNLSDWRVMCAEALGTKAS
jgi:hypothetical protein